MEALRWIKQFASKHKIPMIIETHGAARPDSNSEGTKPGEPGTHGYEWEIAHVKRIISN